MRRELILGPTCAAALLALPGAALAHDRNHDGLPDRWERGHHLSLKVKQARHDQDHDGVRNRDEYRFGTSPRDRDSDDDGRGDGAENAGTIASFTGGVLALKLVDGSTIQAKVTDATEIECESAEEAHDQGVRGADRSDRAVEVLHAHKGEDGHGGDHGVDDRSGSGDDDQGDDHGDHGRGGDDHGDDRARASRDDACGVADLTAGTAVHEAEIRTSSAGAVFEKVELIK